MAGLIRDADVVLVRERASIASVIGEHLQLRGAGGGRLKGLCPFHDEKTPSFSVNPALGFYHCFGCGENGDVIAFVQKLEHLSFPEAVERLAGHVGVDLHYEQGGSAARQPKGQRARLVEVNTAASEFFVGALAGSGGAGSAREFLTSRGFDREVAASYGCGYAPGGWDVLIGHLRGRGFSDAELLTSGLASEGRRGPIDRFRDRLLWPIRDITGDIVGFGARRLSSEDSGPKYLNTPETPLYRKSAVLYGVDRAKGEIARRRQAVVVEGYTDVMACHLAGVPTAVATCGTAFGVEHVRILRRLLMDQDEARGEVVFTFDGDEAGQRAAQKAFAEDQRFVAQTFVAVSPDGLDPCDLRLRHGDAAVRDLVARRTPLFEFALRRVLDTHDLSTPEGRVTALTAAAPVVARIRDRSLRPEYARRLAGWLGMDVESVMSRVSEHVDVPAGGAAAAVPTQPTRRATSAARASGRPDDAAAAVEREALKAAVQQPVLAGPVFDSLESTDFLVPAHRSVREVVTSVGGTARTTGGETWVARLRDAAPDDVARSLVTELAVEPLQVTGEPDRYVGAVLARVQELAVTRRTVELKSRMERLNPVESAAEYNRLFGELVTMEAHRRSLRERAMGAL